MSTIRIFVALCTVATVTNCTAPSHPQVQLRVLHQSQHCGGDLAGLRWLSPAALAETRHGPSSGQHLGDPAPLPAVGDDEKLLLVSLGQKNSGGYGLALLEEQTTIDAETVILPLEVQQPSPGSMQTMQLTSPCMVIGLHGGGYRKVIAEPLGSLSVEG